MKRIFSIIALAILSMAGASAQIYSTQTAKVSFFSKTPVEDISAVSNSALAVLNTATGDLAFAVTNTSFDFPNDLMEEHFNEKYMESEKYAKSTFKGKINEKIDFTKDGEYKVTVTGKLNIHGVEQDRTISGTIVVKGGTIRLMSDFQVKNADHKIEIPTIVSAKIAEALDVKVDAELKPKK